MLKEDSYYSKNRERVLARMKSYRLNPEVWKRVHKYNTSTKRKEIMKLYMREYNKRPGAKERIYKINHRPGAKEARLEYARRPKIIKRNKIQYMKKIEEKEK